MQSEASCRKLSAKKASRAVRAILLALACVSALSWSAIRPAHAASTLRIVGARLARGDGTTGYSTTDCPGMTYRWTVTGGRVASGQGTPRISVTWDCDAVDGLVEVQGTGGTGAPPCSASATGRLAVGIGYAGEAPLIIDGPTVVCEQTEHDFEVFDYTIVTQYRWQVPPGAEIVEQSASGNRVTVLFGTASGELVVVPTNSLGQCPSTQASKNVEVTRIPSGGAVITGRTVLAPGDSRVTYSVPRDLTATAYEWFLPPGVTYTPGTPTNGTQVSLDFPPEARSGELKVRPKNDCGVGKISSHFLTVRRKPESAGEIRGPTTACVGMTSVPYSVEPVSGATDYAWTLNGASLPSTKPAVRVDLTGEGQATLSVRPKNSLGDGPESRLIVDVTSPGPGRVEQVVFDHAELSRGLTKELVLDHCFPRAPCVSSKVDEAYVNIRLSTGEDYEFGSNPFEAEVEVQVSILPMARVVRKTLRITQSTPEQLLQVELSADYHKIDRVQVEVAAYRPQVSATPGATAIEEHVRLTADLAERRLYDVRSDHPLLVPKPAREIHAGSARYNFEWSSTCQERFPNFEFQLLRLFNTLEANERDPQAVQAKVDWSRALTIETQDDSASIELTVVEGSGFYVWRVRPIGNLPGGIANPRNWGEWSESPRDGDTVTETTLLNGGFPHFIHQQLDENINWIYSRTFTEGDSNSSYSRSPVRIGEQISYANGLQQLRQTQVRHETEKVAIATQTLQDFAGRPALQSLPVPVGSRSYLKFAPRLMTNEAGGLYTAANFDSDANFESPDPVSANAGEPFAYYSDENRDDLSVPHAQGYPFSRKLYYSDGTDRVKEQSGVGGPLRIRKDGARTRRVLYAKPTERELVRVLGDEAPKAADVFKMIEVDPNHRATATYISKEGNVIAKSMSAAGANPNLDAVEPPVPAPTIDRINVTESNTPWNGVGIQSSQPLTLTVDTTIVLRYELTPQSLQDDCHDFCKTCDYLIEITVIDAESPEAGPVFEESFAVPPIDCDDLETLRWPEWPVRLSAGEYRISRRIRALNRDPTLRVARIRQPGATGVRGFGPLTITGVGPGFRISYLESHVEKLKELDTGQIREVTSDLLTRLYEEDVDTEVFYRDLGVDTSTAGETARLSFGCGALELPVIPCGSEGPEGAECPDAYRLPVIGFEKHYDFERYFEEQHGQIPANGPLPFAKEFRKGQWNQLIANMLSDPQTPYTCGQLWTAWKGIVDAYEQLTTGMNESLANPELEAKPAGMTYKFDCLEVFLKSVGRRLRATSTVAFSTDFNDPGFLSHAYMCFHYVPDPRADCERGLYYDDYPKNEGVARRYPNLNSPKQWEAFYDCVQGGATFNANRDWRDRHPLRFPETHARRVTELCKTYCKLREHSIRDAIVGLFHNQGRYIVGVDTHELEPEPSPWTGFRMPGRKKLPAGFFDPFDEQIHVRAEIVDCMVRALIKNCQDDCALTAVPGGNGYGDDEDLRQLRGWLIQPLHLSLAEPGRDCPDGHQPANGSIRIRNDPDSTPCSVCFAWLDLPETPPPGPKTERKNCPTRVAEALIAAIYDQVDTYLAAREQAFLALYHAKCIDQASFQDKLIAEVPFGDHHFTLFYYDRAGDLIRSVPPGGITTLGSSRSDSLSHGFPTEYAYDSLGQLVWQQTPDGGVTEFHYNKKGQLRFVQDAQQKADGVYTYTKYDRLGRVVESGESGDAVGALSRQVEDPSFPGPLSRREQVVETVFSEPALDAGDSPLTYRGHEQRYLRNRVSYTYRDEDGDPGTRGDRVSTYYSYDPHGNVEWLVQEIPGLGRKSIAFEYDLVSERVRLVKYCEGRKDQFFHRYTYDGDGRLRTTETSRDGVIWERESRRSFYAHGPLRREEIGEDRLQGIDFVMTLQGWLKGINHPSLEVAKDPGRDRGPDSRFAKDIFGMSLGYFAGDYKRQGSPFVEADQPHLEPAPNHDLYDGNVSTRIAQVAIPPGSSFSHPGLTGVQYRYNVLYRLKSAQFKSAVRSVQDYLCSFTYDANGKLTAVQRRANGALMDDLALTYLQDKNQLSHVDDTVAPIAFDSDIDDQDDGNYRYDRVGRLSYDRAEEIESLSWDRESRVREIKRAPGSQKPDLKFKYDAAGHRVIKQVVDPSDPAKNKTTYYVRHPDGRTLAIYTSTGGPRGPPFEPATLEELTIYGSKRLGILSLDEVVGANEPATDTDVFTRSLGVRRYEISDLTGNVRALIGDVKESTLDPNGGGPLAGSFAAQLLFSADYYPFGMRMPGRAFAAGSAVVGYRYGFQGMEHDSEVRGYGNSYTTFFRNYDPRLSSWLSVDPKTASSPALSPYVAFRDNPIRFVDPRGDQDREQQNYLISSRVGPADLFTPANWTSDSPLLNTALSLPNNVLNISGWIGNQATNAFYRLGCGIGWVERTTGLDLEALSVSAQMSGHPGPIAGGSVAYAVARWSRWARTVSRLSPRLRIRLDRLKGSQSPPGLSEGPVRLDRRWRVGDPHDAIMKSGREPSWSTVRSRYWKNRAASAKPGEFTPDDLARMRRGRPPRDPVTGKPIELEHIVPQRSKAPDRHRNLLPVTDLEHSFFDKYRKGVRDVQGKRWKHSDLDDR